KLLVLPVNTVKSVSGTTTHVVISAPDARLQSVQWQFAMKVGSVSNPYVTAPQAQWPVNFLPMSFLPSQYVDCHSARLQPLATAAGPHCRRSQKSPCRNGNVRLGAEAVQTPSGAQRQLMRLFLAHRSAALGCCKTSIRRFDSDRRLVGGQ